MNNYTVIDVSFFPSESYFRYITKCKVTGSAKFANPILANYTTQGMSTIKQAIIFSINALEKL